jgi:hypothetical protein
MEVNIANGIGAALLLDSGSYKLLMLRVKVQGSYICSPLQIDIRGSSTNLKGRFHFH